MHFFPIKYLFDGRKYLLALQCGRWEDEMVDKTLFDGRVNFRVDGLMLGPATPYYEIYSSH